ncbi:N-acetylglucosamine kinase [Deinococcus yavapaiensis]|uniref:Glucosamine kinase n=1 Tax=Deinococcus yavapaiensis KR-236 TaxID=694435 RepID=A0A318SBN0_9DEIO|nr:BadF/BadG/BcrA/BcrD ATPase family protein [Deinococcus yavapaiensis]PYE54147.1 glucosamine kinase [Deinococcus yavapaiensis KR-236]
MTLHVGLDVGGTSARAVVVRNGEVIARGRAGGGNLRQVGPAGVMTAIHDAIRNADSRVDFAHCRVHAGIAGLATPVDEAALFSVPHGFASFTAQSDAQLTLGAYFGGMPGVLLIVGTGVIVLGRGEHGETGRRLGYGFPLETASGAALGLKAMQLGLARWNDSSPLAALLRTRFDSVRSVVDAARGQGAAWYASHAPLVFEAAALDDPDATATVKAWRSECREAVESLRAELGVTNWGAWGGLTSFLGDLLETGYQPPRATPEEWAATLAGRQANT